MAKKTKVKVKKETKMAGKFEAKSMEELLAQTKTEIKGYKKGEMVKGRISAIKNKAIYIDIGGKTDGIVAERELSAVKSYVESLKIGDEVEVRVQAPENDRGQILLSLKGAASGFGWNLFEEKMKTDGEVEVLGRELNRGGVVVVAPFGFLGFIPGSQIGFKYNHDPENMLRKKILVKVLEVDQDKNRLVFSERLVSEPEKVQEEEKKVQEIKVNQEFVANIVRVEPFGLFVKVEKDGLNLEGLVHISEVSWEKVDDLQRLFRIGKEVKVVLISKEDSRLQFSVKRLLPDPWEGIAKRFGIDKEVEGEVVRVANFGILVRLEPGIEGLIHVSKLTPDSKLNVGDKVKVYVESLDVERRKISLGMVLSKKPLIYK